MTLIRLLGSLQIFILGGRIVRRTSPSLCRGGGDLVADSLRQKRPNAVLLPRLGAPVARAGAAVRLLRRNVPSVRARGAARRRAGRGMGSVEGNVCRAGFLFTLKSCSV